MSAAAELAEPTPAEVRERLHVARARLVMDNERIPAGHLDWTHPDAQRVQLAELEWESLTEKEQEEGLRGFLQKHGLCLLVRCSLVRRGRR